MAASFRHGIEAYGDHERVFCRGANRLLEGDDVAQIKRLRFAGWLLQGRRSMSRFPIAPVVLPDGTVDAGREEVYWRIVRPREPADVKKPKHCDAQFHVKHGILAGATTLKCWIPLWCEPGCGLMLFNKPG